MIVLAHKFGVSVRPLYLTCIGKFYLMPLFFREKIFKWQFLNKIPLNQRCIDATLMPEKHWQLVAVFFAKTFLQ